MALLMVITDVHWLVVIWIADGKLQANYFILRSITQNRWLYNFPRSATFQCFVTFMATVGKRTFLCMDVMFRANQKILDCFLLFYLQFVPFSFILTADSEIKKTKNQQLECLYLMISGRILQYTLWKVLFVETIADHMQNIISVQIIWCNSESILVGPFWFIKELAFNNLVLTDS